MTTFMTTLRMPADLNVDAIPEGASTMAVELSANAPVPQDGQRMPLWRVRRPSDALRGMELLGQAVKQNGMPDTAGITLPSLPASGLRERTDAGAVNHMINIGPGDEEISASAGNDLWAGDGFRSTRPASSGLVA